MLPIAVAFRSAPAGSPRRAAQHLLLWVGVGIAITLAVGQDGLLISNARDGTSALLDFWSPRWELWSLAPSFIRQQLGHRVAATWLWWLAIAAGAAVDAGADAQLARRRGSRSVAFVTFSNRAAAWSRSRCRGCRPAAPKSAHDRSRRPVAAGRARWLRCARAARVDRLRPAAQGRRGRRAAAARARREAAAAIGSAAGARDSQRPLLAAGRHLRHRGAVQRSARSIEPLPLSLQIGRNGPPLANVDAAAASRANSWQTTLWLPVDASFVGLRGPVELERAIDAITITPTAVVDAGARPLVPDRARGREVCGRDVVTFTTSSSIRSRKGSGRWADRPSQITVATPPGHTAPVMLRMHPGAKPNTVTFSTFGWQRSFDLVPGQAAEVELPQFASGVVPLTITRRNGVLSTRHRSDVDRSAVPRRLGRSQAPSAEARWVNHDPTHRSPPRIRQPRARRSRMRTPIRSSNSRSGSTKR